MELTTTSTRIRAAREAKGLSASALARLVGVSAAAVWCWEREIAPATPRRPALAKLAKVLGVAVEFLLTGAETGSAQAGESETLAAIIEDTKVRLARATGWPIHGIRVRFEFATGPASNEPSQDD
jgi:transcriptional regulator with XRE-family HTH domain